MNDDKEFSLKIFELKQEGKFNEAKNLCDKYINSENIEERYQGLLEKFGVYTHLGAGVAGKMTSILNAMKEIKPYEKIVDDLLPVLPMYFFFMNDFEQAKNYIEKVEIKFNVYPLIFQNFLKFYMKYIVNEIKEDTIFDLMEKIYFWELTTFTQKKFSSLENIEYKNFLHQNCMELLKYYTFYSGIEENITLLVTDPYNDGIGDQIQNIRYLFDVAKDMKKIVYVSNKKFMGLSPLIKANAPENVEILDYGETTNDIPDAFIPLDMLPFIYKYSMKNQIKVTSPILKANSEKVMMYKEKYFNNDNFKIGIKWKGDPNCYRNIKLKEFESILNFDNVSYYSLQKGEGIEELANISSRNVVDLGSTFDDFTDTAEAIENLDLLICNDTSLLHLAGSMGKKCFALCQYYYDPRWYLDFNKGKTFECVNSSLYESVHLFRQIEQGVWTDVFEKIEIEIKKMF